MKLTIHFIGPTMSKLWLFWHTISIQLLMRYFAFLFFLKFSKSGMYLYISHISIGMLNIYHKYLHNILIT